MEINPIYSRVENEGCSLYYWSQGTGPLILLIPGGSGHGAQFNPLLSLLSRTYTCATYDRRQMSSSTVTKPAILSHPQQARDAAVIIRALGFSKAIIFGSSFGGIIGFQLAIDLPEMIDFLIAHESPTPLLLPDATKWYEFFFSCRETYKNSGVLRAAKMFQDTFTGYDDVGLKAVSSPPMRNVEILWEYELMQAMLYTPDLRRVKENGMRVAVVSGLRSRDAWYARCTIEQASILECRRVGMPGHHQGFEVEVEEFFPVLLNLLRDMEDHEE